MHINNRLKTNGGNPKSLSVVKFEFHALVDG
jgi:hypothetical protein